MTKKSKNNSVSKVFLWQFLSKMFLQGIAFFTVPIFTRILTTGDYGVISLYSTWLSIFVIFIGLQTHGSIANAKIKYDEQELLKFLSSILTISLISFIVIFSLVLIFINPISVFFSLDKQLVLLLPIHSFFYFCLTFYLTELIQFRKPEKEAFISVSKSVIVTILAIYFVLITKENKYLVKLYVEASVVSIIGLFIFIYIMQRGRVFYNKNYWNFSLSLTLPLIFHGIGGLVLAQSDRVMLGKIVSIESTGIYSVGYSLSLIISIIWGAANNSWVPFYYEYKKNNQIDTILKKSNNYLVFFTIITSGFILCAPEVFKIMAPVQYHSGLYIIPIIALSYYLNFLYTFPANFEFYNRETRLISLSTILAALVNIGLNFYFIRKWGIIGAALTTLISYFFLFVIHDLIARFILKKHNFEYSWFFYLKGLIPVSLITVLYYITLSNWLLRWTIAVIIGLFLLLRIKKNKTIF